jgi:hypothetical protein
VVPVDYGMMVGSREIIESPNPQIGLEPEFAFFQRNHGFNLSVGFRVED